MTPRLTGIDHIHVSVSDWATAEPWYEGILGLRRVETFLQWAEAGGPLYLSDPGGTIHLALFQRPGDTGSAAIAFGADGEEFLAWKDHLEAHGVELEVSDHDLAFSMYFKDPDNNMHEITTYEHDYVREHLVRS